jgi:hypothetical protein
MNPFRCGAAGLVAVLLVGCASAPERIANNAAQAATETVSTGATTDGSELEPIAIELKARDFDPNVVYRCRDMLKPGSNVIVTYCGTGADWKKLEAQQARIAREMLRTMQGSGFPY